MTKNLSNATPACLRTHRADRPARFVDTPYGKIDDKVLPRLMRCVEEDGFAHADEAIEELSTLIKAIRGLRDEHLQRQAEEAKKLKQQLESSTNLTDSEVLNSAMREYIRTGDITCIAPAGRFKSPDEVKMWQPFTMADIKQVRGRTLIGNKTSNGRTLTFMVLADGVEAKPGRAVLRDDGEKVTQVFALGQDADFLSKNFNALYRGV